MSRGCCAVGCLDSMLLLWAQLAASLVLFFNVNYFEKVFLNKMKDGNTCKSLPSKAVESKGPLFCGCFLR